MPYAERGEEHRQETRLLVTTIVVAVGMLLLLARFRFPAEPLHPGAEITPAPLERLAARATYDELARVMADLEARVAPTVAVVPLNDEGVISYASAPILAPDRAVAVVSPTGRVGDGAMAALPVVSRDPIRGVAVLDMSGRTGSVVTGSATSTPGPRYVVVVQGTAQGPVLRPLYIGRTDLYPDPRWPDPVLTIPAVQNLPPGAALFSLDGSLIGLVSDSAGIATVIPAAALRSAVDAAASEPAARADLGIDVQTLTPARARGAGAGKGVMVSFVQPDVVGDADIRPGDVVEAIDGIGVMTVAGFDEVAQGRTPGAAVTMSRIRGGQHAAVRIEAVPLEERRRPGGAFGAVLRTVRGTGTEVVSVSPYTAAAQSGLRTGDVIVGLNERLAPDAAVIERAFRSAASADVVLLTVQRDGSQRIVALEKP